MTNDYAPPHSMHKYFTFPRLTKNVTFLSNVYTTQAIFKAFSEQPSTFFFKTGVQEPLWCYLVQPHLWVSLGTLRYLSHTVSKEEKRLWPFMNVHSIILLLLALVKGHNSSGREWKGSASPCKSSRDVFTVPLTTDIIRTKLLMYKYKKYYTHII